MSAVTLPNIQIGANENRWQIHTLFSEINLMAWRSLVTIFRDPASVVPGLMISVFFLLVYDASLSKAASFFLAGQSYLGFILPVSIVSSALSGSGVAGQAVVRDIGNGYFNKLLLTPVNRAALLLGPMISGAVVLAMQTALVIGVGVLMGLRPVTGVPGLLVVMGLALMLGIAFAGFVVGIALRTSSAAATAAAGFLFFPLSFLTATFTPVNLLSGWIKVAATYNPITYMLEAMRTLLNTGWDTEIVLRGFSATIVMAIITFTFAFISLRARTRRQ